MTVFKKLIFVLYIFLQLSNFNANEMDMLAVSMSFILCCLLKKYYL